MEKLNRISGPKRKKKKQNSVLAKAFHCYKPNNNRRQDSQTLLNLSTDQQPVLLMLKH